MKERKSICTFDVFDTVLVRAVGSHHSLFILVGRELAASGTIRCSPEAFAAYRIAAENRAARNGGSHEPPISKIYEEIGDAMRLPPRCVAQAMEAELTMEQQLIRPVPGAAAMLNEFRTRCKVVFVSDMYLPADFIRGQLQRHQLWQDGDSLFVSADRKCSKATGKLFDCVASEMNVSLADITHRGNDAITDLAVPARLGLSVAALPAGNLSRYEALLESYGQCTSGVASALAGAARLARLSVSAKSPGEVALRDVAAGVVAPTLIAYVMWVLREASRQGIQQLYFVSRDGEILLPIAQRLVQHLGIDVGLHYLYGSRQAWHIASADLTQLEQASWLWERSPQLTLRQWLRRLTLAPEELVGPLSEIHLQADRWDAPLDDEALNSLHGVVNSEPAQRLIARRIESARELAVAYLHQEGFSSGIRIGYVDLGWRGRMQQSLARLMLAAGADVPAGFYFGLFDGRSGCSSGTMHAFAFDLQTGIGFCDLASGVHQLLEVFCAGREGQLMGYQRSGGRIVPQLREPTNSCVIQWGLDLVRETVRQVVEQFVLVPGICSVESDLRPGIAAVLSEFWHRPEPREAHAWGGFPSEDDQAAAARTPLARPFHAGEALSMLVPGRLAHPSNRRIWEPGAFAATSRPVRFAFRAAGRFAAVRNGFRRRIHFGRGGSQ